MNTLYSNYTASCGGGMVKPIGPDSTDHEVRKHMLGGHNERAQQEIHRARAYVVSEDGQTATPYDSRGDPRTIPLHLFIPNLERLGIVLPEKLEKIVIFHAGLPVDTMTEEEFEALNENPSIRKPLDRAG